MKKIKTILAVASAVTLAMLGSCTPSGSSVESSIWEESPSSEQATASKIKNDGVPYLEENVELDLDNYITIEYSDGTTDHTYDVTCSKADMIIEGHKIKSAVLDAYNVVISAGGLSARLSIEVFSHDQIALIEFVAPLETDPRNFSMDLMDGEEYYFSYFHNAKYTAVFDKTDPTAIDDETGSPDSTILAKLADGNGYWGAVVDDGTGHPKAQFEPGIESDYDYYYFTMDMLLDAADSTYVTYQGEEVLMLGATFTQNLLNYGASQLPDRSGYTYYGSTFIGFVDTDNDQVEDGAKFSCLVQSGSTISSWCDVVLYDVGTTSIPWMQTAITTQSYIPDAITGGEITTAFAALAAAGNYTMTVSAWTASQTSLEKQTPTSTDADACAYLFGTGDAVFTQKYTADGIYSEFKGKALTDNAGTIAMANDYTVTAGAAAWDDGTTGYKTTYAASTDTGFKPATTLASAAGNIYSLTGIQAMTASSVTAAGVNSTVWGGKTADTANHTVTLAGKVGDNDGTTATNLLFKQMIDMLGSTDYGILHNFGTSWTDAEDFDAGDKHALTLYSDYESFEVNTTTNEISVVMSMYAPIGLTNGYFGLSFEITDIGTTSFDFSTLVNGTTGVTPLA